MRYADLITELTPEISNFRRRLHTYPELCYEEFRTADAVAVELEAVGIEVVRGLGKTGVVGILRHGRSDRSIGLRADMDGLPITELNMFDHRSTCDGKMHACGHDGHVAMLMGSAQILAHTRNFDGTVYFIFQPAEEGGAGGRAMIEDGLFERFPMSHVFALHNWPGLDLGKLQVFPGPVMAGADTFAITIRGNGGHAAVPERVKDPVLAGCILVQNLQSIVSRIISPKDSAVISVTCFHAGTKENIIPDTAEISGTVRTFDAKVRDAVITGIHRICNGIEISFGVSVEVNYQLIYPAVVNAQEPFGIAKTVACDVFGHTNVCLDAEPSMVAEDFAFLANEVPGCYAWIGNGPGESGCQLHSAKYDFNDQMIPLGVSYWVALAEAALAPSS